MRQIFRTKLARILAAIALAVALYAVAGFVIAPKLARKALLEDIPKTLVGVTPTVGEIHINPFLFQVEVKDFALDGKEGGKLLGFERLFVEFDLSSLWHRAYTFGRIELNAPYANASVAKDGTLNLLALRPKPAERVTTRAQQGTLPAVRVGSFKVTRGTLRYEDHRRPTEFAERLEPINFELRDFTTGAAGGLFALTGSSELGERVEWHGHLSVQPIESDGEFRIDGLRAHTIWEYLEDRLNFVVNSGSIDLNATYKFSLKDSVALRVDVSKVEMSDLAVRPRDSDIDWVTLPRLVLTGTTVDLAKPEAHVDSLSLSGLKLSTWLEPDGSVNLLKLAAAPPGPPAESSAGATPAAAPPATASASAPWRFDLRHFELRDASISGEDRGTRPVVKVLLAPLSLEINEASLDLAKPVSIALDTRINETGSLTMNGEVTPQPAAAALTMKLAGIDLTALQAYIARFTSMTLRGGLLAAEAELRYATAKQKPAVQFTGDIHVDRLRTVDNTLHDDFVNWERLDILGLNYQQGPDRLDIAEIVAQKPYARVIIESDTSLNVKRVLTAPGAAVTPPAPSPPATVVKATRVDKVAKVTHPSSQPMPISIKKVVVRAGRANFTDLSIRPNFSAGIQSLEGTVLGLSSKSSSRAKVDLHGSVGEFSPVSITGEVNLLSAALYTDMGMRFENIELSIFNPYSGKFAGYNITEGKLTTDLHYKVADRKLDAQHHIVIDHLEFGDKTESKDAVSLPIKLAVALLKDRNGVIDLNLPVTGSLDDPKFSLGPVIWTIFVHLLEKVVTAPFALLGALFEKGPDIQFIEFHPGDSALDAAAADKAKAVAKALNARPALKIEVPIAVVPDVDRPALIAAQFTTRLSEAQTPQGEGKQSTTGKATAGPVSTPFEQLDPTAKLALLTQVYLKTVGTPPNYPDAVTAQKQKSDVVSAKIDFLTKGIQEHVVVGDAELKALGEQRAQALQQALLTDTQVAPERVFLVANDKATSKNGLVLLELSLR